MTESKAGGSREGGYPGSWLAAVAIAAALVPAVVLSQTSAQPGETVRNVFGPLKKGEAKTCRGACGVDCPKTCEREIRYECQDGGSLLRVAVFVCGTHQGCREHDDCLNRCSLEGTADADCRNHCHAEAIQAYGLPDALSWAQGGGPFDGETVFEYTKDGPEGAEPVFRCPEGSRLACADGGATCIASSGATVAPVFETYLGGSPSSMRVSDLKAGPLCEGAVCGQSTNIAVTGEEDCGAAGACTRYGIEFDYIGADPAEPLRCSTSTSGVEDDFIGGLIKTAFDGASEINADTFEGNPGLGELLGALQKVVGSGDSPEDVQVSIAPLGPDGKPIESQRVGSAPKDGLPPVPHSMDLPAAAGHLVIPMYEVADTPGQEKVKRVQCTHKGEAVLEATFSLSE